MTHRIGVTTKLLRIVTKKSYFSQLKFMTLTTIVTTTIVTKTVTVLPSQSHDFDCDHDCELQLVVMTVIVMTNILFMTTKLL